MASTLKGWFITKDWPHFIRKILVNTLKYSILILGSVVSIFPLYWMFNMAVSSWGPQTWLPLHPHLENFIEAWNALENPPLWRAFLNSTIVTVSRTLLVLFISSLTAYALAIYKFRGSRVIFLWIIMQIIIQGTISLMPGVIYLIPTYLLMHWLGWYNTYWSLIIPAAFNAYSIFLIRQYIITIPDDLLDAARLSGCSEVGLFWRMVLPLSKPALGTVALMNVVWAWNEFLWPMFMIKDKSWSTVQMALTWVSPGGSFGAALITLTILPLLILTLFTLKYLVKGFAGLGYTRR